VPEIFSGFHLSPDQWLLAVLSGMMIGMAKTGITGFGMLMVPIMAGIFGGRPSTGIVLPMLCVADVFAVSYYHRHAAWKHVLRLMPPTVAGILIGLGVGAAVPDILFKAIIGVGVAVSVALMAWRDLRGDSISVPDVWWFSVLAGLAGGFFTMIGNAAGPVMALYFLAMRLPKNTFIGTTAWFFMIVNLLKVPLHLFVWGTITTATLAFDTVMIPAICAGALLGVRVVRIVPEKPYRVFIMATIVIAAVKMFF